MGVFDGVKEDEGVQKAIATFVKVTIWGALIIGGMLFLEKLLNFGFDISVTLGL